MRTDVKVGLICAFALVLAAIIYFVAQGNTHPARAATPLVPSIPAASPSPAVTPQPTPPVGASPAPVTPIATPAPMAERSLAGAVSGGSIIPPAPGSGATPPAGTPPTPPTFPSAVPTAGAIGPTPPPMTPGATPIRTPGSESLIPSSTPRPTLEFTTPPAGSPTLSGTTGNTYEIQKGDMLGPIAKKFGVTVDAIKKANPGINPNNLKVKSTIKIPAGGTGIASSATHTPSTPAHTPSTPAASSLTAVSATPKAGATYKVKKGDTLTTIAKAAYGNGSKTTIEKIVQANRAISNPNVLALNTELKLP